MSRPLFTPEELAELARIDAELESAPVTADELAESRRRDRAAKLDAMDKRARAHAEQQRQYREAHREEIAERMRQYREAHREEIAEQHRQYYAAHREEIAEQHRQYYAAHREEIAEQKRQYYAAHREEVAEQKRQYYAAHREEIAEQLRQYYAAHREEIAERMAGYCPSYYYADRPTQDGIRARRKALRMSQAELAHRVGVSPSLICMVEKGRCTAAPQTMRRIEEALEEMEGAMT